MYFLTYKNRGSSEVLDGQKNRNDEVRFCEDKDTVSLDSHCPALPCTREHLLPWLLPYSLCRQVPTPPNLKKKKILYNFLDMAFISDVGKIM